MKCSIEICRRLPLSDEANQKTEVTLLLSSAKALRKYFHHLAISYELLESIHSMIQRAWT